MKKIVALFVLVIMLFAFTSCKSKESDAAKKEGKVYYDFLVSLGEIETDISSSAGGGFERWDVNKLYYYLDDFNGDDIIDLAISSEKSDSNGIEIYTINNGNVDKVFTKGMPYGAGSEIFTLGKYDDSYGINYYRSNSMGDFSFFRINKDWSIQEVFSGNLYDVDGNKMDTKTTYDKINNIIFYSIDDLKK